MVNYLHESLHYSVLDTLVGKLLHVKIYSKKLVTLYQNQKIAVQERIYYPVGWSIKLEYYLNTLLRKSGAVHSSLALQKMPEGIQKLFDRQFRNKPKDFVLLLQYAQEQDFYRLRYYSSLSRLENTRSHPSVSRSDQNHDACLKKASTREESDLTSKGYYGAIG